MSRLLISVEMVPVPPINNAFTEISSCFASLQLTFSSTGSIPQPVGGRNTHLLRNGRYLSAA
jgi:hypothetical protein